MASHYEVVAATHEWLKEQEAHELATASALLSLDPFESQRQLIDAVAGHWHGYLEERSAQHHPEATQHLLFMITGVRSASKIDALMGPRNGESRAILDKSVDELEDTINRTKPVVIEHSELIRVYGFSLEPERFLPHYKSKLAKTAGRSAVEVLLEHTQLKQRAKNPNNIVIPRPGVAEGVIEPWNPRGVSVRAS